MLAAGALLRIILNSIMFGYLRVISVAHVIAAFFASQGSAASSVYHGHDISSMLMLEAAGQKYYFNGNQVPFDQIIHSAGADYIRSRIWVNPSDGNYNLNYNLALAKRAKALGLKFYLDFHYSGEHQLESYKQNNATYLTNDINLVSSDTWVTILDS